MWVSHRSTESARPHAPDTLVDFHTGDDDVSSLGADDNDRNKSADDLSADGSLEDDDRSFRSRPGPYEAWDSSPPFYNIGHGPPAAAFPSHSRDDASL